MKKKDLLLSDFKESVESLSMLKIKGGQKKTQEPTEVACTSGDVGCCDVDPLMDANMELESPVSL